MEQLAFRLSLGFSLKYNLYAKNFTDKFLTAMAAAESFKVQ